MKRDKKAIDWFQQLYSFLYRDLIDKIINNNSIKMTKNNIVKK